MKASRLKFRLQKYFLKRELTSRNPVKHSIVNYAAAKNIGIIYEADDEESSRLVHEYTAALRGDNKRVHEMGFIHKRKVPTDLKVNAYSEYFSKKHLNWLGIPHQAELEKFIKEPFDVLLSLSIEHPVPLLYISALSKASFRIGCYHEDAVPFYDFMIEPGEKNLAQLIAQTDHYLKQFK